MPTQDETARKYQSGELLALTEEEMKLLLPWLRETLAGQERKQENAELCQLFSRLLLLSHRLYGTPEPTREECICLG